MVAGVILVGVAIGVTSSIQRTALARYKEIGTALAGESIEVFHKERARLGWVNFEATYGAGDYCLNEETNVIEPAPCADITQLSHDFSRNIAVSIDNGVIQVQATVSWEAGNITPHPEVVLTQRFAQIN